MPPLLEAFGQSFWKLGSDTHKRRFFAKIRDYQDKWGLPKQKPSRIFSLLLVFEAECWGVLARLLARAPSLLAGGKNERGTLPPIIKKKAAKKKKKA